MIYGAPILRMTTLHGCRVFWSALVSSASANVRLPGESETSVAAGALDRALGCNGALVKRNTKFALCNTYLQVKNQPSQAMQKPAVYYGLA